jgi:predicted  nucleic acid-binding Zn-ribbon protein
MTIQATAEQRDQLLALQELYSEIARLQRRAADPPEQREATATAEELSVLAKRVTVLVDELSRLRELAGTTAPEHAAAVARVEADLARTKARGQLLAARHREARAAAPAAAESTADRLAHARARRAALADQLDDGVLGAYETARRHVADPAIVALDAKGSCGGCHLTIPAVQLDRIRSSTAATLPRCPECDRYLVTG